MKKRLLLTLRGKRDDWTFVVYGDSAHLKEWQSDGLEIYELVGILPMWMQGTPLERPWLLMQKIWQWMRVF